MPMSKPRVQSVVAEKCHHSRNEQESLLLRESQVKRILKKIGGVELLAVNGQLNSKRIQRKILCGRTW